MFNKVQDNTKVLEPEVLSVHSLEEGEGAQKISIQVQQLTKIYKNAKNKTGETGNAHYQPIVANNNISFEIQTGDIFGLLGPNGAGKTTLVSQLLGLTKPTSGQIIVEGINVVNNLDQVKAVTSYLPQKGLAFGNMEVSRCLDYTGQLRGLNRNAAKQQSQQLIKELDLAEVAKRYVHTLSGGMRRLVGFAMALMGQPKLLVLDEPTNELDPVRRRQVWETIKILNRERGTTCLLVTHNVLEAETVIKHLAVISEGKIVAIGTPGQLKQEFSKEAYLKLSLKPTILGSGLNSYDYLQALLKENSLNGQVRLVQETDSQLHFRIFLPTSLADRVMSLLIHYIGLDQVDDFHLALPSLEDVYLKLVNAKSITETED